MPELESATATPSEPGTLERELWGRCVGFDRRIAGRRLRFTACARVVESNGKFLFKLCGNDKCLSWNLAEGEYSVGIEVAGIGIDIVAKISELTITGSYISFKLNVDACFNVIRRFRADLFEETIRIAKLDSDFKSNDVSLLAGTWVALIPQD